MTADDALRWDYRSARYGEKYDDPRADLLAEAVTDFESEAMKVAKEKYSTRHDSPHLDNLLGIDPDDPGTVAAGIVVAIRPLVEDLMFKAMEIYDE